MPSILLRNWTNSVYQAGFETASFPVGAGRGQIKGVYMVRCIRRKFPKNLYANLHVRFMHGNRQQNTSALELHYHPIPEIYVFLTGICRIQLNNCVHLLQRGTLIWIAPGQVHIICDQSLDCTFAVCSLKPQFLKRFELQETLPLETKIFNISEAEVVYLEHFFSMLPPRDHPARIAAIYYGSDHLLRLLKHDILTESHVLSPGIEKVLNFLMQSKEKPPLSKLVQLAGMSSTSFQQQFKLQMNMTFSQYWNRLQVRRFLAVYDAGKRHNISEAVYQAGFGSYAQFYRVFTRISGYTPKAFQRLCASRMFASRQSSPHPEPSGEKIIP